MEERAGAAAAIAAAAPGSGASPPPEPIGTVLAPKAVHLQPFPRGCR